ncbi:unnamed protein product [Diatraea saccharalis]|uniref:Glycosyltransferase family 92 protein n=1 Tax=Diatraea saccharalis TaxID=40085 RepID=A0A9N9WBV5_9NEOP|nr:unnamed protein product [Diatraea saccharalis]
MPWKYVRATKFVLAGVTLFCVSWIASVNEWNSGVRWSERRRSTTLSTMRTIVAYSEGKQAEMDRPSPVACDRLPAFPDIPYINHTWSQGVESESSWQRVSGTRVRVYAAYYDERLPQRYVRILATFHGRNFSTEPLFCQTRLLNNIENSVEVVAAKPLEIWWHEWDAHSTDIDIPLLLSCPLTEPLKHPSVVSIVTQPCDDPTNAFYLAPVTPRKYERNFTICVKDMNFADDISQDLIEWIETNRILGVEMIDLYIDKIKEESENTLLRYRNQGYVRLYNVPTKYKPDRSLWQRRRDHIITYNDCLYRNIRESEFIIPLDLDEIVLPKTAKTLPELIKRLEKIGWDPLQDSAILVRNVFFFGFMQGVDKYKLKSINNDVYVKRDDVRIKATDNLDIGEIELVSDNNNIKHEHNEVIDFKAIDSDLYDIYKSRCKQDLLTPKLVQHIVSSITVSPIGYYSKSLMLTRKVLTAFNHYPLANLGTSAFAGWYAPLQEVQLNHYKESCNTTVMPECGTYGKRARFDRAAQRLRRPLTKALAYAPCPEINNT